MSFSGTKKPPLISVPYLKKRLRRLTALGFHNLTVYEFNFTVHFTLHRNEKTIAFYTSEKIENQRSPEWSYLQFPVNVACLQEFILRVWITSSNHCCLLLEYDIYLDSSLIPDEQKEKVTKGNNCLWLEVCGYRFTDNDEDEIITIPSKQRIYFSKSYDKSSIIRMITAIHSIRTEKQGAMKYFEQLETCLQANKDYLTKIKERESRRLRVEILKEYLQFRTNLYQQRLIAYQQRQKVLEDKRNQLNQNISQLKIQQNDIILYNNNLNQSKSILRNLTQIINFRQKEIINQILHYIYPIEIDNQNELSIANAKLPQADDKIYQSTLSRERDHEIAAAIGYCSHFILIIAQTIHLPLRFPIDYHAIPTMKIYDYTTDPNEYPLFPSTNLSAFRYGFYLLNRNIGQMMYHCRVGDRHTDFRNTLENIKELIEEYFINSTTNNEIQLYPSLQATKSVNSNTDEQVLTNEITSSVSSTLSIIENDDNDDMELFPQFNSSTSKTRLAIEITPSIQY